MNEIHVNIYTIDHSILIGKLIKFINEHEDRAFLSFSKDRHSRGPEVNFLDRQDLIIHLYYYEELSEEIDTDDFLNLWIDGDCFEIDQSEINILKISTPKTIDLLLKLSALNKIYYDLINGNSE